MIMTYRESKQANRLVHAVSVCRLGRSRELTSSLKLLACRPNAEAAICTLALCSVGSGNSSSVLMIRMLDNWSVALPVAV